MHIQSASRQYSQTGLDTNSYAWRAGLWTEGKFSWLIEGKHNGIFSEKFKVDQLSSNTEKVAFWRLSIPSFSRSYSLHKLFFEYTGDCGSNATAFYSPSEQAILHSSKGTVTLLGGIMEGKGLSQYSIRQKGKDTLFKSMLDGTLNFSPLGKGNIVSTFSLEAQLAPGEDADAIAWMIVTQCKDEAVTINTLLKNRVHAIFH
ncbi:hypothetical protein CVD28_23180 [Bacillus sp. M6-12]|uniref:hypothetical protein n=1 Tax=Bacillus sp. M6-12 TaxID=2054166 RepID=UPI000C75D9A3|nr:hypothetical protein [Bacillus sp. M6-12]PLS15234.1 hypothetical protein CVD28_23180 [Bacillus sp. M6-12]